MSHKDYKYIDTAFGGANKRNNVIDVGNLKTPQRTPDCFTTCFRFKKEYLDHVETTGSVRGSKKFSCWSDYLWFDIDNEDLDTALSDVKRLLIGFKPFKIDEHIVVFFSGSKGFHVGVKSSLFGFEPSINLPAEMKITAEELATSFQVQIDTVVYDHNRLWRIPGSVHGKTKLRKTQLSPKKIYGFTDSIQLLEAVKKSKPTPRVHWMCKPVEQHDELSKFASKIEPVTFDSSDEWYDPGYNDKQLKKLMVSLELLLSEGETKGSRDNGAMMRASECRKVGYEEDETLELIIEWNVLNDPELSETDITRIVKSAFTGEGYDFGTKNNDALKDARSKAKEMVNQYDDDDDFATTVGDKEKPEPNDFDRFKPLSLTEIAKDPDIGKIPDTVGEYITWKSRISLLVGSAKYAGKSTLCTYEARAALEKGHRVLWITNDEPLSDVVRRFQEAKLKNKYAENLFIAAGTSFPVSWKYVEAQIRYVKPDLVILDSLHSVLHVLNKGKLPEQSETAKWQALLAKLRPVALELDLSILWIHHSNKMGVSAGSIGISAAVDVIIDIKQVSATKQPNRRKLSFLGRFIASHDIQITFENAEKGYKKLEFSKSDDEAKEYNVQVALETWLIELFSSQAHNNYTIKRKEVETKALEQFKNEFASDRACKDGLREAASNVGIKFINAKGLWQMSTSAEMTGDSDDE